MNHLLNLIYFQQKLEIDSILDKNEDIRPINIPFL